MDNNSEILLYQTEDGQTKIDVRLEEETVWLSQVQMAKLFQTKLQRDRFWNLFIKVGAILGIILTILNLLESFCII